MLLLQQERAVEQERLRIARNIHDDLGARITQVSLLSGVSQNDPEFPERAREAFGTVSTMCRDLVSALYETVWTVAAENDNLEALGSYLGQMVEQLARQSHLHCRLHLLDLPLDVHVSSHTRHHVTLAVKEAVHNVIKHAQASELILCVGWDDRMLTVSVQDDGRGFPSDRQTAGHGVANMKRRLSESGGTCTIRSQPGRGTTVEMRLELGQS
jgi:signal transduction histidine kinase